MQAGHRSKLGLLWYFVPSSSQYENLKSGKAEMPPEWIGEAAKKRAYFMTSCSQD